MSIHSPRGQSTSLQIESMIRHEKAAVLTLCSDLPLASSWHKLLPGDKRSTTALCTARRNSRKQDDSAEERKPASLSRLRLVHVQSNSGLGNFVIAMRTM